jgi:hypothetical protein
MKNYIMRRFKWPKHHSMKMYRRVEVELYLLE